MNRQGDVIDVLTAWAGEQPLVRALLLTSSQANPNAPVDALSDYDIVIVATRVQPLLADEIWVNAFAAPLVRFRDSRSLDGFETHTRLVLYEDGTKVDYTLWPEALLARIVADGRLPDQLDVGYRVLLDKDGVAGRLAPPTYTAHIPPRPSEADYLDLVEEFWWETSYVAKNLWRDELFPAKYSFESVIKFDLLRRLLEWSVELDHDWSLKPGALGRGLKRHLPPDRWSQIEHTFVDADLEANWAALFATAALFREVAATVGDRLGYTYPYDLDERMMQYLARIKNMESEQG
jgi:aminoglycoside 6-adenylyltransferase